MGSEMCIRDSAMTLSSDYDDNISESTPDSESNTNLQPIQDQTVNSDQDVQNEQTTDESDENHDENITNNDTQLSDSQFDKLHLPNIGDQVEVLWPAESTYLPGIVTEITNDDEHVMFYDDGDIETLDMKNQDWR